MLADLRTVAFFPLIKGIRRRDEFAHIDELESPHWTYRTGRSRTGATGNPIARIPHRQGAVPIDRQ
jgi:hypothetical protein